MCRYMWISEFHCHFLIFVDIYRFVAGSFASFVGVL